jgi:hypothetical protein
LESRPAGNCTLSYGTKTNGSWLFTDQPVGPDWENGITGFVDYDLGVVVLGVVVHYPYEVTEVVDCGTGTFNLEHAVHDIFGCTDPTGQFGSGSLVGTITEVDGGPDTVDFTCHEQGPGLDLTEETITISGTLTLADEPPSP